MEIYPVVILVVLLVQSKPQLLNSQMLTCIYVVRAGVGGQANCFPAFISPAGVQIIHVGDPPVQVNCTIPQSNCSAGDELLPAVVAHLRSGNGSHTTVETLSYENDRCIFVFSAEVRESFASLHCALPDYRSTGCNSEELHLLISPEISDVTTDSSELHTYTCTLSCKYNQNWYKDKDGHLAIRGIDPKFMSNSISDCIDGFQTHKLSLNVTRTDFIDVLPTLTCGGRDPWEGLLHFSKLLIRGGANNITENSTETTSESPTMSSESEFLFIV